MLSIRSFNPMRSRRSTVGSEPSRDFMRDAVNLLATFRFFAVVIVVTLTAVLESRETQQTSLVVLATIAAVISLVIVAIGRTLVVHPTALHVLLVVDTVLSTAGILAGGGVDSPFLMYALLPPLTAALLLHKRFAALLAAVPGITVALAHALLNNWDSRFQWILEGNYLTLVPVYGIVGLAVALLPFYANLNLRRGEQDVARRAEQRILRGELHDKLAQSLSALTMGLRQMNRVGGNEGVGELVSVSEQSYAELRELLDLLEAGSWQPTTVGTLGHLVETWQQQTGVHVTTSLPDGEMGLPPEVALAILGIAREALTNIGKHSGAREVWVDLQRTDDAVTLSVRDNGRGFPEDRGPGHGRRIMQERANSIGAALRITSKPGAGTEVQVQYTIA